MNPVQSAIKFHQFEPDQQGLLDNLIHSLKDYKLFKRKLEKKEYHKLVPEEMQELAVSIIQSLDLNGHTILEQAVQVEDREMIEMLLALKVDLNAISSQRITCGCFVKSKEFLFWLFEKGLFLESSSADENLSSQARVNFVQFLLQNFNENEFNEFLTHASDCKDLLNSSLYFYLKPMRLNALLLNKDVTLKKLHSNSLFHENFSQKILSQIFPLSVLTGAKSLIQELSGLIKGLKYHDVKGLEEIIFYILMIPWQDYKYDRFLEDITDLFNENIPLLKDDPHFFCLEETGFSVSEMIWAWAIFKSKAQAQLLQSIDHLYSFKKQELTLKQNQLVAKFINQFLLNQNLFWKELSRNYTASRFEKLLLFLLKMGVNPFIQDARTKKNLLHQSLKTLVHVHEETYLYVLKTYPDLILTLDGEGEKIVDKFFKLLNKSELLKNLKFFQEILQNKEELSEESIGINAKEMISPQELKKWIGVTLTILDQSPAHIPSKQLRRNRSSRKSNAEFIQQLESLTCRNALAYFFSLYTSKEMFRNFADQFQVRFLNLVAGGDIQHNYAKIATVLLEKISTTHFSKKSFLSKTLLESVVSVPQMICELEVTAQVIKTWGRNTLLVKEKQDASFYNIFKFRKSEDTYQAFAKEKIIMETLLNNAKKFKSQFPEPLKIYCIKRFEKNSKDLGLFEYSNYVYHFKAKTKFCHCIHDSLVSDQAYLEARSNFIHDVIKLLKCRIRIGLGPLGKFNPVPDLFKAQEHIGAQALRGGLNIVEESVMRESGLGDIMDGMFLLTSEEIKSHFKSHIKSEDKVEKSVWFTSLATIFFVDTLNVTLRFLKLEKINWEDATSNKNLAHEFITGFTAIMSHYTGAPILQVHELLVETLPWMQMAKEISFWVQKDAKGFSKYLQEGVLPENLYLEDFRFKKPSNTNEVFLGIPNGPLGLVSAEKIIYIVSLFCFGLAEYKKVFAKKL